MRRTRVAGTLCAFVFRHILGVITLPATLVALVYGGPLLLATHRTSEGDGHGPILLCNDAEETIVAAVGFPHAMSWTSMGWYRIAQGHCRSLSEPRGRSFYVFARTVDGTQQWSGHTALCTADTPFVIRDNHCGLADRKLFAHVSNGSGQIHRIVFHGGRKDTPSRIDSVVRHFDIEQLRQAVERLSPLVLSDVDDEPGMTIGGFKVKYYAERGRLRIDAASGEIRGSVDVRYSVRVQRTLGPASVVLGSCGARDMPRMARLDFRTRLLPQNSSIIPQTTVEHLTLLNRCRIGILRIDITTGIEQVLQRTSALLEEALDAAILGVIRQDEADYSRNTNQRIRLRSE